MCISDVCFYSFVGAAETQTKAGCVHVAERARVCGFRASLKNPLILNYIDTLSNLAIELNMQVLRNFNIHWERKNSQNHRTKRMRLYF